MPERYRAEAERLHAHLTSVENTLKLIKNQIKENLKKYPDYAKTAFSIPGAGPVTALCLYAFLGDCERFSSGAQAAYYAGLTPRVDISGETVRYGHITKRGNQLLRRAIIQAAWRLVRSGHGGRIKEFFEGLHPRIGKKKAIVAAGRKMVEVFYAMITNGSLYADMPADKLKEKLAGFPA